MAPVARMLHRLAVHLPRSTPAASSSSAEAGCSLPWWRAPQVTEPGRKTRAGERGSPDARAIPTNRPVARGGHQAPHQSILDARKGQTEKGEFRRCSAIANALLPPQLGGPRLGIGCPQPNSHRRPVMPQTAAKSRCQGRIVYPQILARGQVQVQLCGALDGLRVELSASTIRAPLKVPRYEPRLVSILE